ncbi:MAG: ABC transporter ATP-binding protein [Butyrivibrio sp.]|nr:ABC transporter ATP-binding protein [Butyrivibrio sp.]
MEAILYRDVTKKFNTASEYSVDHVNASIKEGEFITILGSSGCGKTTLLKMTNRLYEPTEGKIILFGEDISTVDPIVVRRRMGYVIQQVGLFPHMTIEDNIAAIPKLLKWDREKIYDRVTELLKLIDLDPGEYRKRFPAQLSGGQQQRVGLARALVTDPKIMLMDEPFGAIDAITRLNLQNELKKLHQGMKKTFLLVTHDINEAFKLGDRVMIMNEGKLLQFDEPGKIVRDPANDFVDTLIRSARDQEEFWEAVKG